MIKFISSLNVDHKQKEARFCEYERKAMRDASPLMKVLIENPDPAPIQIDCAYPYECLLRLDDLLSGRGNVHILLSELFSSGTLLNQQIQTFCTWCQFLNEYEFVDLLDQSCAFMAQYAMDHPLQFFPS